MKRQGEFLKHLGVALVAVSLGSVTAAAQERPAPDATASAQHESGGKAGGDGIKVHGHWTIDVRNPDGTLASHNEFENALRGDFGAPALARLLTRDHRLSSWQIQLNSGGNDGPCSEQGQPARCHIYEPGTLIQAPSAEFPTLALRTIQSQPGGPFDLVEVTGNVTVTFAQPIYLVMTAMLFGSEVMPFSERSLAPTGIQVAVGQTIYVKVTFSFS